MGKTSKKDKKKHKKERKHKSKHIKEKKRKHSSSSSETSESEWVEKVPALPSEVLKKEPQTAARDEWMGMESIFGGKTRKELNEDKKKPEKEKEFNLLDKPGQSSRELNPYWKNGGTGLPQEKPSDDFSEDSEEDSSSSDDDSPPRRKPHKKEHRERHHSPVRHHDSKRGNPDDRYENSRYSARPPQMSRKLNFRRPDDDSSDFSSGLKGDSREKMRNMNFRKPGEESRSLSVGYMSIESNSGRKSWRKPSSEPQSETKPASERCSQATPSQSSSDPRKEESPPPKSDSGVLTLNQMNELSASILKAELMGNKGLAEELKAKLKEARLKREENSSSSEVYDEKGRKVVILTETDSRGFTRPTKNPSQDDRYSSKKKRKADTHDGKSRVRYFPDDDKYSLKEMFEKEKYSTSDDQNATFIKLMSKQKRDDDMADEAAFDSARMDDTEKDERRRRDHTIKKFSAKEKAIETCRFCISGKNDSEESIVLTEEKVYLAVPTFQSLTEGHCLIVPQNHVTCSTVMDEDIWEEMKEMRRKLVKAFEKDDEDVIFFETAMYIDKYPHMKLHCVPVPREIGDTAPIFFKKAILECENEWTNNKKVVELAGRDVRRAVPKGLPYFAVDFGMQSGYAHVIEDKRLFPHNFAQEIIGGMLDLDHTIWRKNKRDTPENIKKKRDSLKELLKNNLN